MARRGPAPLPFPVAIPLAAALLFAGAAQARPGSLAVAGLKGSSEAEVRSRLGPPDVARAEGKGALWTYRLPGCALLVFFRSEGEGARRMSGAASSPRRRGETPPAVDACLGEAASRTGQAAPSPAPAAPPGRPPQRADDLAPF